MVAALIKAGADVDKRDREGRTPLIWAAWEGRDSIARQLLKARADVHAKDNEGNSALMVAIAKNNNSVRNMLLDVGATVPLPMLNQMPRTEF